MSRRRWWIVAGAVVALWVVAAGYLLLRAASDLRAGRAAASAARDGIDAKAIADGRPLPDLRRAREKFGDAASRTGNPILLPVRVLPIIGRQVRSAHALASAAHEVSDAAVEALTRAQDVLARPAGGGSARVDQVQALRDAVDRADRRVHAVTLGPRKGLFGPLASAHDELAAKLADAGATLDNASAGADAGLALLQGPRRYLLVAANNAEMRAGSGMWLSGGVLSTSDGHLDLGPVGPLYQQAEPPADALPPIEDADLAARWGPSWTPNADWRALMVSPRLPASAALGLAMWKAAGKEPIDGVLVVDPVALAAVVRATGPVTVGDRTITADQVVPELLHDQYVEFGTATPEQGDRREALGAIAGAAFHALDSGSWSPAELAGQLGKAIAGRHLLAWTKDPIEERGWVAAGMAGDLAPDSLFVSLLNRGGNKLDWYTPIDGQITIKAAGDGTDVNVHLTIRNTTPTGQPRYVAGPPVGQRWPVGTYVGVLTVDVPGAATNLRVAGTIPPVEGRDGAAQVVSATIRMGRGEQRDLDVQFHLPGHHGSLDVAASGRVPGISWHYGTRTWQDTERRAANW